MYGLSSIHLSIPPTVVEIVYALWYIVIMLHLMLTDGYVFSNSSNHWLFGLINVFLELFRTGIWSHAQVNLHIKLNHCTISQIPART